MKVISQEMSPIPRWYSCKQVKLKLTQTDLVTIRQAAKIFDNVEKHITNYLRSVGDYPENFTLSDIDFDLSRLCCQYELDNFLEEYSENNGILLDTLTNE